MQSGELIVPGLSNRIIATFEEMSETDEDALSNLQTMRQEEIFPLIDTSGTTFSGIIVTVKSVEDESNNISQ